MAQKISYNLVDDIDGGKAVETISFGRPVDPPDPIAFQAAATRSGSGLSSEQAASRAS